MSDLQVVMIGIHIVFGALNIALCIHVAGRNIAKAIRDSHSGQSPECDADCDQAALPQQSEMPEPTGRIMCRKHEWLDEKPCPYCAEPEPSFEEWKKSGEYDAILYSLEGQDDCLACVEAMARAAWNAGRGKL